MTGLILVAGLALVPGDLTSHTVLVAADFAAEDGHVFASNVDLARLAFGRHLWTESVSSVLPRYGIQDFSEVSLAGLEVLTQ